MPNGISHCYQLDLPILRVVGWIFFFHFYSNHDRTIRQQTVETDQTPRSSASGMGLHRFPTSHKKYARLVWVDAISLHDNAMGMAFRQMHILYGQPFFLQNHFL